MNEVASDEHDYANWPSDRQMRLDRFVTLLCDHAAVFGAFSYQPTGGPRQAFKAAYEPALNRAIMKAAELCERDGERGHIVFAQTAEIKQELIGRYFDRLGWDDWLAGYHVMRSRDEPALQAAEIVARGMKRLMQDGGVTHSFKRILETGKPIMFWPFDPIGVSGFSPRLLSPDAPVCAAQLD